MTMFSSCPGNMWSARSSAPVHQIHNQPLKVVMWFPRCRSQRGTHPSDHPVRSAQHTFVDRRAPQGPLGADANLDNLILLKSQYPRRSGEHAPPETLSRWVTYGLGHW